MKYVIFIEIDICHLHITYRTYMKEEHVLLLLRIHFAGFYYLLTIIIYVINNKMYIMQLWEDGFIGN